MKTVKFKITDAEHAVLAELADDGIHQKQTPDEYAQNVVEAHIVEQQSKSGRP